MIALIGWFLSRLLPGVIGFVHIVAAYVISAVGVAICQLALAVGRVFNSQQTMIASLRAIVDSKDHERATSESRIRDSLKRREAKKDRRHASEVMNLRQELAAIEAKLYASRPEVIASLGVAQRGAFSGSLVVSNTGDLDAYNVRIGDLTNGTTTVRFDQIDRLPAGSSQELLPAVHGTAENWQDLILWGQLAATWNAVAARPDNVPREEIDAMFEENAVVPLTITYDEVKTGAQWQTRAKIVSLKTKDGYSRATVRVLGIERVTVQSRPNPL